MYLIKKTKKYFILLLCTVLLVGCSTKSPAVRGAMVGGGTAAIVGVSLAGVKNSQDAGYLVIGVLIYSLFGALIGYIVGETGDDSEKNIDLNHYEDSAHNTYQH